MKKKPGTKTKNVFDRIDAHRAKIAKFTTEEIIAFIDKGHTAEEERERLRGYKD